MLRAPEAQRHIGAGGTGTGARETGGAFQTAPLGRRGPMGPKQGRTKVVARWWRREQELAAVPGGEIADREPLPRTSRRRTVDAMFIRLRGGVTRLGASAGPVRSLVHEFVSCRLEVRRRLDVQLVLPCVCGHLPSYSA